MKKKITKKIKHKGGSASSVNSSTTTVVSRKNSTASRKSSNTASRRSSRRSSNTVRRRSTNTASRRLSSISSSNSNSSNNTVVPHPHKIASLHRTLFDKIRDSIKSHENINESMFLFAKPSKLVNDFLFSIYNENLIRVQKFNKLKFMISVVELKGDKSIYVTIAEEPKSDPNFYDKMAIFLQMIEILVNGGVTNRDVNKIKSGKVKYDKNILTYSNDLIELIDISMDDINKIISNKHYNTNYRSGREQYKELLGIFNPQENRNLISGKKIKFIFNNNYINERRSGRSFEPLYKPDKNKPDNIACNSGSICSESKVFSYLHNLGKFDTIKGGIAYWIGEGSIKACGQKPNDCNYHPKYSYTGDKLSQMYSLIKTGNLFSKRLGKIIEESDSSEKLILNVIRPYALPCPGCTLNAHKYFNNIVVDWSKTRGICLEVVEEAERSRAHKRTMREMSSHN